MMILLNLLGLNNKLFRKVLIFLLPITLTSCSSNKNSIKVKYEIKEMRDSSFDATLSINNTSGIDLNSPWSLHWNQQSTMVDSNNLPENIIYEYVGGQYYNILSFEQASMFDRKQYRKVIFCLQMWHGRTLVALLVMLSLPGHEYHSRFGC